MAIRFGIGNIDLRNIRSAFSWSRYWATRTVTGIGVQADSDTSLIVVHTNNGILDYTGHKYYISTDGINYTLNKIVASIGTGTTLTGLTANTLYYVKVAPYKNTNIGNLSSADSDTTWTTETKNLIDREIVALETPTDLNKLSTNWTIASLKALSLFETQFDVVVLTRGTGLESTKLNWVKAAHPALGVPNGGTLTFTPDVGYHSDGTKSYLRTQYNPLDDGILFQKDNACFIIKTGGALDAVAVHMHGCADVGVNGVIIAGGSGGWDNQRINCAVTPTSFSYVLGWNCLLRSSSSNISLIRNATKTDKVANSTNVPDIEAYILRINFATPFYTPTTEYNECYAFGKNITQANFDLFRTIVDLFYTTLISSYGYCWFTSARAVYNNASGKTWVGMGLNNGAGFSQYILTFGNSNSLIYVTKVGTVTVEDDHNEPSILVRASDSRLFTCYSEANTGNRIRCRISTNVLDATAWGAEATIDPNPGHVYRFPSAFQVTNGDIYIFYSYMHGGGVEHGWCYIKSTDGGVTWSAAVPFSSKPYLQIFQTTNKNIFHIAGSSRPHLVSNPNIVFHFYFNAGTGTWHKSDGTDITAALPTVNLSATTIWSLVHPEQSWIEDLILDSNGYPRVLMSYYPNWTVTPEKKYLYYSEWNGSSWSTPYEIHLALNREMTGTGLQYPPGSCFDVSNPDRIYASKDVGGVCEIFQITRNASNSFTSIQKTTGSTNDQWRPFTINSPHRNVFWLDKVAYADYIDFTQQLKFGTF
jgi:hypothetical protein